MAISELWETAKEAILNYTGLSPVVFFTVLAVAIAAYYTVAGFFEAPAPRKRGADFEESEPIPPPVQLGEVTEEELLAFDGKDHKKPLLMAIKGQIYDVTQSRMFYGPGGPYALFAGKDASRALAKMSFEQKDLTGDISGLGPFELEALQDWEYKFMSKYAKVGTIKQTVPVTEGSSSEANSEVTTLAETTERSVPAESQVDNCVEAERITESKADDGAEAVDLAEHAAKPVDLAEHAAETKEGPTGHGAESEAKEDEVGKGVAAGDGIKE